MSHPLRIEYPGAIYHITSRGNGRQKIYLSSEDRRLFLATLAQVVSCHGYRSKEIAQHLGVHYATVSRRLTKLESRSKDV